MSDPDRWRCDLRHYFRLLEPRTVHFDFRRHTCGPSSFASVQLACDPSDQFRFVRGCTWPANVSGPEQESWDAAISCGVWDALQPTAGDPHVADGVAVTLVATEHDPVGSSGMAFYSAAWHAIRQLREAGHWVLTART